MTLDRPPLAARPERFRTRAELMAQILNRRTPTDTANDIIRLKADANCAIARIDKALDTTRRHPERRATTE